MDPLWKSKMYASVARVDACDRPSALNVFCFF